MKLYFHPFSSNARKAVMTAELLGAPVERVFVDLPQRAQAKPEFLALNPNGKVPVLVDGDFELWESYAIMIYLAEKTPGQTLYPSDPKARADVNRWMFWAAAHWSVQIATLNFENVLKSVVFKIGEADPAVVAKANAELERLAGILDAHLASRQFVSGDALTLADVTLACPLMVTEMAKLPVKKFAHLQAWMGRMQALDAWKKSNPQ